MLGMADFEEAGESYVPLITTLLEIDAARTLEKGINVNFQKLHIKALYHNT
jgi:hypothetical protein